MPYFNWARWLRSLITGRRRRSTYEKKPSRRLRLEELEGRIAPATFTWDGGGGADSRFSQKANWFGNVAPSGSSITLDDLVFPSSAVTFTPQNDLVGAVFNSITFSGSNFNLTGNSLTLGSTSTSGGGFIIVNSGDTGDLISLNVNLAGQTGSRQFFTVDSNANLTVNGKISGNTGSELTKSGTGFLTLAGDDSGYTGPIDVQQGIIQITNANALGIGSNSGQMTTVETNAQLQVNNASNTITGPINEPITINGPGITNTGAILNVAGDSTWSGNVVMDSDSTLGSTAGTLTFNGVISDLGSGHNLTKEGPGAILLNPQSVSGNTYRGTTTVNGGMLEIGHPFALGPGGQTATVNSTTTESGTIGLYWTQMSNLFIPAQYLVNANGQLVTGFGGAVAGFAVPSEPLILNGPGQEGIHVSARTGTGPVPTFDVSGALDGVSGSNAWEKTIQLWTNSASVLGDSNVWSLPIVGLGAEQGATLTLNGVISDNAAGTAYDLVKTRPGEVILTNNNTFGGAGTLIDVLDGTLNIEDSKALGPAKNGVTVFNGGSLALQAASGHVDSVTGTPNLNVTGVTLNLIGSGANGTGALLNIDGTNQWTTGVTTLTSGVGRGGGGFFPSTGAAIGVDADQGPFNTNGQALTPVGLSQLTMNGVIAGPTLTTETAGVITTSAPTLTKVGFGELVLTAANTYVANTFINQGFITVENNAALGGVIAGVGNSEQPLVTVSTGAALILKETPSGQPLNVNRNVSLGTGLGLTMAEGATAARFPWLNQAGALENLDGDNTFGGDIFLNGIASIGVEIDGNDALPILAGAASVPTPPSQLTLSANTTGGDGWLEEQKANSGFDKLGSQRLIVQDNASYTGPVDVKTGVLQIGNGMALGAGTSTTTVETGAALEIGTTNPLDSSGQAEGIDVQGEHLILNGTGNSSFGQTQTLTVTGSSGTFSLTFNGQTTGNLAYNVPASGGVGATASLQNALDALTNIGPGGASVTQSGNVYTITFTGSLAATDPALLTGTGSGGASVAVIGSVPVLSILGNDNTWQGPVTLSNAVNLFTATNARFTLAGTVDDAPNLSSSGSDLTKTGPGELVLSGANTYRGNTLITQGTVTVTNGQGFGAGLNGQVVVSNSANLQIEGSITIAGRTLVVQGNGSTPSSIPVQWFPVGPAPINNGQTPGNGNTPVTGQVTGVAADPSNPAVIYVATGGGGIWKTVNGGQTWISLTDSDNAVDEYSGLPVNMHDMFMGSLAISPSNPHILYAGTGNMDNSVDSYYGRGVLMSSDSGETWTLMYPQSGVTNDFNLKAITSIQVDPAFPLVFYVSVADSGNANGVSGNNGIWKFDPTAATPWTNLTAGKKAGTITFNAAEDDYTSIVVLYDQRSFQTAGPGFFIPLESSPGPGLTNNRFLVMAIGNPDGGWANFLADGGTFGTGEFRNGVYVSLDDGVTWTLDSGSTPINSLTEPPGIPVAGVIKVAAGPVPGQLPDSPSSLASGNQFDIYAAATYPNVYPNTGAPTPTGYYTNPAQADHFRSIWTSNISWSPTTLAWSVSSMTTPKSEPSDYQGSSPSNIGQGSYDSVIAVDPNNANNVFVGGIGQPFSTGPWYSNDGGSSWNDIGVGADGNSPHNDAQAVSWDSNDHLLLGTDGGLWRLDNPAAGGVVWTDLNGSSPYAGNLDITSINSVAVDPNNPSSIVATSQGNGTAVFNGTSWTLTAPGNGGTVFMNPNNTSIIYGVQNLPNIAYDISQPSYDPTAPYSFPGSNKSDTYTNINGTATPVQGAGVFESTTGGSLGSWSNVLTVGQAVYYPLVLDPLNSERLLIGNDGAPEVNGYQLQISLNGGASWQPLGLNLPLRAISSIAVAGYQGAFQADSNFPLISDQGANTYDPNTVYVANGTSPDSFDYDHVFVTKNDGNSWADITSPLWANYGPIQEIVADPRNRDTLYVVMGSLSGAVGEGKVFKTTDAGHTWTDISSGLPDLLVHSLIVDPRTGFLYLGNDNGVWELGSGSGSWVPLGVGMPNTAVTSLELSPNDNVLTAGTYGRGVFQIYLENPTGVTAAITQVSGQGVWTGPVVLAGPTTFDVVGTQNIPGLTATQLNIIGSISDLAGTSNNTLTKVGAGDLILSGSDTYSGETDVQVGNVVVQNPNALSGSQTVVETGAALELASNLYAEPVTLNGNGFLFNGHQTGALFNISNNNSYNGVLTLNTGTTIGVNSGSQLAIGGYTFGLKFAVPGAQPTLQANGSGLIGTTPNIGVITTTPGGPTTDAVEEINIAGGVVGGSFTLTYNGATTTPIPWPANGDPNVLAASMQAALNQIGPPVAAQSGSNVTMTFTYPGPQPTMFADGTNLQGTNASVFVTTTTVGALPSTDAVQTITFGGNITGGYFTLSFNGATTGAIQWSSTPATLVNNIQQALNQLLGQLAGSTVTLLQSATIKGNHSLTKELTGTLVLASSDTYSSGSPAAPSTMIDQGIVNLQSPTGLGAVGSDNLTQVLDGAQLQLQGNFTVSNQELQISGTGIFGSGALLTVDGPNGTPSSTTWQGPVTLAQDAGFSPPTSPSSSIAIGAENSYDVLTIDGQLGQVTGGPLGFTKVGTGMLVLTNTQSPGTNNSYNGQTNIASGIVRIQTGGALGTSSGVIVNPGTALQVDGDPTGLGLGTGIVTTPVPAVINGSGIAGSNNGAIENISGQNTWTGSVTFGSSSSIGADLQAAQTLTLIGASSGTFTLTFGGQTTVPIAYNATAATIQTDLENLSNIGLANAYVTGGAGGPWTIFLSGALGSGPLPLLSASGAGLNAGASVALGGTQSQTQLSISGVVQDPSPVPTPPSDFTKIGQGVVTLTNANTYSGNTFVNFGDLRITNPGALGTATNEVQTITVTGSMGTFTVTFNNQTTGSLPYNVPASGGVGPTASLQNALNALSSVGGVGGSVTVTLAGGIYTVTFHGSLAGYNLPQMSALGSGGAAATVAVLTQGNGATYVANGAGLQVAGGITVSSEPLTINGNGYNGTGALENFAGANTWARSIVLASNSSIGVDNAGDTLVLNKPVVDDGNGYSLTKFGAGTLDNQTQDLYTGSTTVYQGTLLLDNSGGPSLSDSLLSIGGGPNPAVARWMFSAQVPAGFEADVVNANGLLDLNGHNETLNTLSIVDGNATTDLSGPGGQLTVSQLKMQGGTITLPSGGQLVLNGSVQATSDANGSARITGAGSVALNAANVAFAVNAGSQPVDLDIQSLVTGNALTQSGNGRLELDAMDTYAGPTTINAGTVQVDGSIGNVILNGGTLGGLGTVGSVTGTVPAGSPASFGTIDPGDDGSTNPKTGTLNVQSVTLGPIAPATGPVTSGSVVFVDLEGADIVTPTQPGMAHDVLNINGNVNLNGATLNGTVGSGVRIGDQFTILTTTGGTVSGRFAEPYGSGVVFFGTAKFGVTYNATSVVLTRVKSNVDVKYTASTNPSTYGQFVTFTATVTPEPGSGILPAGEAVTFLLSGGTLASPLSQTVSLNTSSQATFDPQTYASLTLGPGQYNLGVIYNGDANFNTGSTLTAVQVSPVGNSQQISFQEPGPQPVFTATNNLTGTNPTITVTTTTPGAFPSTPAIESITFGGTVTGGFFTLTFNGATTGNINWDPSAVNLANNIQAALNALVPAPEMVNQDKTNISDSASPTANPVYGQSVTITASVTAVTTAITPGSVLPTGSITFFLDGNQIPSTPGNPNPATISASGLASIVLPGPLSANVHLVDVQYSGDTNYQGVANINHLQINVAKDNSNVGVSSSVTTTSLGQTVTFTATLTAAAPGTGTPSGTVTFYDGTLPGGTSVGTASLNASGVATLAVSSLTVGTHSISVSYPGDTNFLSSSGTLNSSTANYVVSKGSSSTVVTSSGPTVFGQAVTFSATVSAVSPAPGTPTGNVQFVIDGVNQGAAVTLSGGLATMSMTSLAAGNHTIVAKYNGDSNFLASDNTSPAPLIQAVGKASTTTTVTLPGSSVFGQAVTFTATIAAVSPGAGIPTGTVTFSIDGVNQNPVPILSSGKATFVTSTLSVGGHSITATYGGDTNFLSSNNNLSSAIQNVTQAGSKTVVTSSGTAVYGQTVTFSVTVTAVAPGAGTPSGTITFVVDGANQVPSITLANGQATFTDSVLTVGTHTIGVSYNGDTNFFTSNATSISQTVNLAHTTTVVTSSGPSVFGQPVTFTASVAVNAPGAGTPTGTVTFVVDGAGQSPVSLIGNVATFVYSAFNVGTHKITATYNGDLDFVGSNSALFNQSVGKDGSSTAVSAAAGTVFGQSLTLDATVTAAAPGAGTPTGNVTFVIDGVNQTPAAPLSGGVASFATGSLSAGPHNISAIYNGDASFTTSTALTISQTVGQDGSKTVVSTAGSTVFGQPATFTATVSAAGPGAGTPTGSVTFVIDGVSQTPAATLSNGQATFVYSGLSVGSHNISANYGGDTNFLTSTAANANQTVFQANSKTTVTSSGTGVFGQAITFTANITAAPPGAGTPTGDVTFVVDGVPQSPNATLSNGQATFGDNALSIGSHNITAVYNGDTSFLTSNDTNTPFVQSVIQAASSTSVTSSGPTVFGQVVTLTATVTAVPPGTGTPAGQVTFAIDGVNQNPTVSLVNGQATLAVSTLSVATHRITAFYLGDPDFGTSNNVMSPFNQSVSQANSITTMSVSANPSGAGQAVTFTATVTPLAPGAGNPTGTVTFSIDGVAQSPPATVSGGIATLATTSLSMGTHTLSATYNGDVNFITSTSPTLNQQVLKADTIAISASTGIAVFGQTVTFSATVSPVAPATGTPTGSVDFFIDGSDQGPVALTAGTATFSISSLTVGAHTITASYNGDPSFSPTNASNTLTEIVNHASTTTSLTVSPSPANYGQTLTLTAIVVAVAPGVGTPTGTVTFTVDGSAQPPVTMNGGQATLAISSLNAGSHNIIAKYNDDANFSGSSSAVVAEKVNQLSTDPVLTASGPIAYGQTVTFTAAVSAPAGSATPAGNVIFVIDGVGQAAIPLNGSGIATISLATLSGGVHAIKANFQGSTNFAASSDSTSYTVNQAITSAALTSSVNPSTFGQVVTFTASITNSSSNATPTGTVQFVVDGANRGNALTLSGSSNSASATLAINNLQVGPHTIYVTYAGNNNFAGTDNSGTPVNQTVNQADTTTTITSSPNPSTPGQKVVFSALVVSQSSGTGTPTGTVTFNITDGASVNMNVTANVASTGRATFSTTTLPAGIYTVTATYNGSTNFAASVSAPFTHKVAEASTTRVTSNKSTPSAGQPITFTARVGPAGVTGTVTFYVDGVAQAPVDVGNGVVTLTLSNLRVGRHTIRAVYSGDANFNGSSGSHVQTVYRSTGRRL